MTDIKERRTSPRIHCYSRSMVDDNVEHGLVVDISETGACLLISKDTSLFKDLNQDQSASSYGCIRLNVFHPDYSLEEGLDVSADITWLDQEYSKDRLKLGVHFAEMDDDKSVYVSKFIDWIQNKDHYFLHSEIEKC